MSEKKFFNWVGFKDGERDGEVNDADGSKQVVSSSTYERIRELESQLAELRSRRDITALSKEEFEILATETAMQLVRTAQQRESKSVATAERILTDSKKKAAATLESAESQAKSSLQVAESRGRKYIEAAEADAAEVLAAAERESEDLLASRKKEANALLTSARKEAERVIQTAATEVTEYRTWLTNVISEAERLYRIQTQSLDAAESAIAQSRQRLDSAFNRLAELQREVSAAIATNGTPAADPNVAARIAAATSDGAEGKSAAKSTPRRVTSKRSSEVSTKRSR